MTCIIIVCALNSDTESIVTKNHIRFLFCFGLTGIRGCMYCSGLPSVYRCAEFVFYKFPVCVLFRLIMWSSWSLSLYCSNYNRQRSSPYVLLSDCVSLSPLPPLHNGSSTVLSWALCWEWIVRWDFTRDHVMWEILEYDLVPYFAISVDVNRSILALCIQALEM